MQRVPASKTLTALKCHALLRIRLVVSNGIAQRLRAFQEFDKMRILTGRDVVHLDESHAASRLDCVD